MIGPCPVTIYPDTLARDVLDSADCLIATQVQQGYAALLAPGGSFVTALTIALTIYVAIFGYRLILGLSSITLGEVVPHFIKIGIILALVTSWASYQVLVFDLLFQGPEDLANLLVAQAAGAGSGDVMAAVQTIFDRLTDAAADAWAQVAGTPATPVTPGAPATPPVPVTPGAPPPATPPVPLATPATPLPLSLGTPQFVAILLWLSAMVMMAGTVGVLLVVRIVLALLLLLGPVFIALALFRTTRGLAEGWLRVTFKFAIVPVFALPLIAGLVGLLAPLAVQLEGVPVTSVRDGPVLLILLVVLVFAAVMAQAARLGGGIAAGLRLPRGESRAATSTATQSRELTLQASENRNAIATAGRAETIVQAIDAGNRRTAAGSIGTTPAAIVATRTITGPVTAAAPVLADTGNRLGQGYRRLAVTTRATAPRPRI